MKRILACAMLALWLAVPILAAQGGEGPSGIAWVVGPRVGVDYTFTSPQEFSTGVNEIYPGAGGTYFPVNTVFCVSVEQRILLGETRSHFAFQEVLSVSGIEQGFALPTLSVLIGYRDYSGLEFGVGPTLSFSGIGVIAAAGWTLSYKGVYVPFDIHFIIPNYRSRATIGLTTGFNFRMDRSGS